MRRHARMEEVIVIPDSPRRGAILLYDLDGTVLSYIVSFESYQTLIMLVKTHKRFHDKLRIEYDKAKVEIDDNIKKSMVIADMFKTYFTGFHNWTGVRTESFLGQPINVYGDDEDGNGKHVATVTPSYHAPKSIRLTKYYMEMANDWNEFRLVGSTTTYEFKVVAGLHITVVVDNTAPEFYIEGIKGYIQNRIFAQK